eukprot:CAMPEP_0198236666 /NCGR_PEP_ID=MMETSP1446-20131203/2544_1 /TAXON_ID=1461542 ORGANISM="Unidentified sp, Strain CCMP2111" /NCGR_SAMPLE_ID=MMETSP1446 /ASSEMBLY_ACC=CAM_ASM_001112 /LENGTH=219 /DNA_ID=CAMNT_0043918525 /DNA_START=125 /DNA_END=781 /DNA_ORIENTATION=+
MTNLYIIKPIFTGEVQTSCLCLVTPACPAATRLLELASLRAHEWLGVGVWDTWGPAEVLDSFTAVLWSPQQDGSSAGGGDESELIESQALSASLQNPLPSSLCEAKGANAELGHLVHADVVCDRADQDSNLAFLSFHELRQLGQRQGRPINFAHEESLEDDLVELRVRAPDEKLVQLDQQLQVDIVRLRRRPGGLLVPPPGLQIDRHVALTSVAPCVAK